MGPKSEDRTIASMQDIMRIVHNLKESTAVFHSRGHSFVPASDIPVVNLPSPRPLLHSLLEAGFSHEVAAVISKTYQHRAEEFRQQIQESIVRACRGIAELPVVTLASSPNLLIRKVVFTFTELYLRRLEQWKEEIVRHTKHVPQRPVKMAARNFTAFNRDYVPLLEHFFEENPFPTHADKMFLAKKSNMEYRQIHVWFQNRRNRTKREGKSLRKKTAYEGATKPLNKLYERTKGYMAYSDSQAPKPSQLASSEGPTETEVAQDSASKDTFTSSSPPHAFPSAYPPTCHYDPFPCKSGSVYFSKSEWRRVPCGKHTCPPSTSIDDLVEMFSRLNVRDETRPGGSPKLRSHAATVAITVVPPRAPHPSLIFHQYSQPTNIVQFYPSVRAPASHSNVFQSPSSTSQPATLIPLDPIQQEQAS